MLLTSFDPFTQEFDRFARRVFGTTDGGAVTRRSVIPMDSIRRKDEVELRFDLPGIDPSPSRSPSTGACSPSARAAPRSTPKASARIGVSG